MSDHVKSDWEPRSEEVLADQRMAYDQMRERCPVAYSEFMGWSLFRHEDISRALQDHETFSNVVSQHRPVPNGMDPPEHTAYRRIIEPYFDPKHMNAFEPVCRKITETLIQNILASDAIEFIADFAQPFAVRAQCAFLRWPATFHERLIRWTTKNYKASLAQDKPTMTELAHEFEKIIDEVIETRIQNRAKPDDDITASLMFERVEGSLLTHEEIASILRNWTVGEMGTISASIGILVHTLAYNTELQMKLRTDPSLLPVAIDEILRMHGSLVSNRRITTRPVSIGGRQLGAGERISLNWVSANRDERVFEAADTFRLDRDPANNLFYGLGIHVCPGAPLARLELRVVMEELLRHTTAIEFMPDELPINTHYPASGFSALPLGMRKALLAAK